MYFRSISTLFVSVFLIFQTTSEGRVYKNVRVGEYKTTFDMADCDGKTFLSFMINQIYPAMVEESKNMTSGKHIDGVKTGEGLEIRLTQDVTTYHVKFKPHWEKNAERSGRSFSAVGKDQKRPYYVADASYKHYLSSLQEVYEKDPEDLQDFYEAILGVVASCDASAFSKLNSKTKEVAADFVAVYIAEQYRHLISGKGEKLGRSHNWDDALLQVTLLGSFHAGQQNPGMFYEGRYTSQVYHQLLRDSDGEKYCLYKQYRHPKRDETEKRDFQFIDYWQFNKKCDRSGVNITRRDFEKMGSGITTWAKSNQRELTRELETTLDASGRNIYDSIASFFISNSAPNDLGERADDVVDTIVEFLMQIRNEADTITENLE